MILHFEKEYSMEPKGDRELPSTGFKRVERVGSFGGKGWPREG